MGSYTKEFLPIVARCFYDKSGTTTKSTWEDQTNCWDNDYDTYGFPNRWGTSAGSSHELDVGYDFSSLPSTVSGFNVTKASTHCKVGNRNTSMTFSSFEAILCWYVRVINPPSENSENEANNIDIWTNPNSGLITRKGTINGDRLWYAPSLAKAETVEYSCESDTTTTDSFLASILTSSSTMKSEYWRYNETIEGVQTTGPVFLYRRSNSLSSNFYYNLGFWELPHVTLEYSIPDFTTNFTYSHATVVATGGTGTITSTSIVTDEETPITLTTTLDSGYYLMGWKKNGTLVEGSNVTSWTTQPSSGDSYEAYIVNKVQVTVSVVDEDDQQTCGEGLGGGYYVPGTIATVQANPDTYHVFNYWEESGSYDNPMQYTVPGAASSVTAYCRKKSKMIYKGDTTLYAQGITNVKGVYKGDTEIELKVHH